MIKKVTIKNFMTHANFELKDIPAINVIIGKNDTGKTGLLKLLYATVKTLEWYSWGKKSGNVSFKKILAEKLNHTFMPRKTGLGDLVQQGSKDKLVVNIDITTNKEKYQQTIHFSFGDKTESTINDCIEHVNAIIPDNSINALFIPAKEVLTAFNDIRGSRRILNGKGFDDTYLDLIESLSIQGTKGRLKGELSNVNRELEELFEGKIEQSQQPEQPFIFKKGNHRFSMPLTAEGIKKIGILTTLINNRQLRQGTVLFMDEPETALHPDAIRKIVEMLVAMSKADVQIFIASHSYFFIKQLAICAKRDKLNILCWNLEKEKGTPATHSFHNLIDGVLPPNTIINEALAMYDQEIDIELNK